MKNNFNATEWQSFSIKKDIESINKNTKRSEEIQLTAMIEICLSLLSVAGSFIFDGEHINIYWSIVAIALAIAPLIWIIRILFSFISSRIKPGKDLMNKKDLIDIFDNEVCYYVMMAESYYQMYLENKDQNDNSKDVDIRRFYLIESCYYLEKTIQELSLMANSPKRVFSNNVDEIYYYKKVSISRLINILNIIKSLLALIEDSVEYIKDSTCEDASDVFLEVHKKYIELHSIFKNVIQDSFNVKMNC
ncbi:MAG: hypothetical protein K0S41_3273 [Anaerocolumna sp.]|jgi:hypothetical protein|nr:hypothetical protein [Anaerocolumna sp.]